MERDHTTPLDQWIHLKEQSRVNSPLRESPHCRLIVFNKASDIPILLSRNVSSKSTLGVEAEHSLTPSTPMPAHVDDHDDDSDDDEPIEATTSGDEDASSDHVVDLEAAASSADADRVGQVEVPPTEEEVRAADCIRRCYRQYSRRRRASQAASSDGQIRRWFLGNFQTSRSLDLSRAYRIIFLGPLPHALVSLEMLNLSSSDAKKTALSHMKNAEHQELEDASAKFDKARCVDSEFFTRRSFRSSNARFSGTYSGKPSSCRRYLDLNRGYIGKKMFLV